MQTLSGEGKLAQLAARLRQRIVAGDYPPGSRLPTRDVLERDLRASRVTVQRVFDLLAAQGLIETRGRSGTFVADHPPHRARYALVFPRRRDDDGNWPIFYDALEQAARDLVQERFGPGGDRRHLVTFFGLQGHRDVPAYQQLMSEVQADLLAGLIFVYAPTDLADSPLLTAGRAARVAIMQPNRRLADVSAVALDMAGFADQAMAALARRKRRRVAVMLPAWLSPDSDSAGHFVRAAKRHKVHLARGRLIGAEPRWARATAALLASAWPDPPDGIVIADDNLLPQASAGIDDALAGSDQPFPDVIAHANFPNLAASKVPVLRLGFDVRRIVQACFDRVDSGRPGVTRIAAVDETAARATLR